MTTGAYAWIRAEVNLLDLAQKQECAEKCATCVPWLYGSWTEPGTTVWRIVGGQAVAWPVEDYGQFYQQSVFLILTSAAKDVDYDVNLWIGKGASEEDYLSGVSVATELRRQLGSTARLHRHVQGLESSTFRDIFSVVVYWNGNPSRSYRACMLQNGGYKTRMLQLYTTASGHLVGKEVPCNVKELDPAYTYVLDVGDCVYVWQGDLTSTEEDMQSIHFVESLRLARGTGVKVEVLNTDVADGHSFFHYLSKDSYRRQHMYEDEDCCSSLHRGSMLYTTNAYKTAESIKLIQIYYDPKTANRKKRKSIAASLQRYELRLVKQGHVTKRDLTEGDIFLIDTEDHLWIWYSKNTLHSEKLLALQYTHDYLRNTKHPNIAVSTTSAERPHPQFDSLLHHSNYVSNGIESNGFS